MVETTRTKLTAAELKEVQRQNKFQRQQQSIQRAAEQGKKVTIETREGARITSTSIQRPTVSPKPSLKSSIATPSQKQEVRKVAATPSPTSSLPSGQFLSGITQRTMAEKRVQEFKREPTFSQPFFSFAGQKERLVNVGGTFRALGKKATEEVTFGKFKSDERIRVNVESRGIKEAGEKFFETPVRSIGLTALPFAGVSRTTAFVAKTPVGKVATATAIRRLGLGAGIATAETAGIVKGTEFLGQRGLTKQEQKIGKKLIQSGKLEQIQAGAVQRASQKGRLQGFAANVAIFGANRDDFIRSASNLGLSKKEIDIALQLRSERGIGESAAQLNIARFSEGFGRREISKAFQVAKPVATKKLVKETFKTTFKPIARAGFIEGGIATGIQQRALTNELTFLPKVDFKKKEFELGILGGATVGAATAGLLGGVIAGTAVSRKATTRGVSKVISTLANIADPFELVGDISQDITEKGVARALRRTPILTLTPSGKKAQFGVQTKQQLKPFKLPEFKIDVPLKFTPEFSTQIPTVTKAPTKSKIPSFTDIIFGTKAPTKTKTPVFSPLIIPTQTKITSPIPIITETPVPIITETPVPIKTPTPVFTPTPVKVPTTTPLNIPPLLPLELPLFSGTAGRTFRGKKKFVNEVDLLRKQILSQRLL